MNTPSKTILTIIAFIVPLPLTLGMCYALLQTMTAMGDVAPQILAGAIMAILAVQVGGMFLVYILLIGLVALITRLRGG